MAVVLESGNLLLVFGCLFCALLWLVGCLGALLGESWGRKVAYVLRFRHVEFTTLRNQVIFYQKNCWFRSVVNAILQK